MGDALGFGWDTMKANIGFFIGVLLVAFVIEMIPEGVVQATREDAPLASFLASIISSIVQMAITMGIINISLKYCDGEKAEFGDLFNCFPLLLKYVIASILYMLIIIGGLLLLIVPGIIWSIKFFFCGYFVVDRGMGPIEALKQSAAITKGAKWDLFLFGLLTAAINIAGALCCLVGLFATVPTTFVAYAYVYRTLVGHAETTPPMGTHPEGWPTE
jgi:uncharacterized membrane protein